MAATGYTPISLYYSSTAAATPTAGNLVNGELAINITDGKLYYKDNGGTVKVIAGTGGTGVVAGSNTQVQYNNNGVFGASSNFTFDGTNIGLAGGTANGVAYLNGSKVLTTGSALTFDGTTLNFGGTEQRITGDFSNATIANRVMFQTSTTNIQTSVGIIPNGTATSTELRLYNNSDPTNSARAMLGANASDVRFVSGIDGTGTYLPMTFYTGGSERMRIDTSGNVGIGNSSPNYTPFGGTGRVLSIGSSSNAQGIIELVGTQTADGAVGAVTGYNTSSSVRLSQINFNRYGADNSGTITFLTNNAGTFSEKMRLDSSGNLGLGVTPSAWDTLTAMQIKRAAFAGYSNSAYVASNAYYSSGWKYLATGTNANRYQLSEDGTHQWHIAPSGTAGNAISFTQAMTLDASGNLGIGTSSPAAKLDVRGAGYFISATDPTTFLSVDSGLSTGSMYNQFNTSSNVGLSGTYTNHPYAFVTNNTERMRIDSSGNLLVGTTSSLGPNGGISVVTQSSNKGMLYIRNPYNGLTADQFQMYTTGQAASSNFYLARFYTSGAAVQFAVRGDGTVYAQNTTIQSLSDARTKENVRTSNEGLDVIGALRPVRFDFKEGFGNNRKNQLGFIAQEVEQVFPDAVDVAGESDEEGNPYKSVGPGALIPVLVKAIQELKAELDATKAEVAALKAK